MFVVESVSGSSDATMVVVASPGHFLAALPRCVSFQLADGLITHLDVERDG
jgi:hypothetical protein